MSKEPVIDPPKSASIRILHELIALLDSRVPHVARADEAAIARDAAAIKLLALRRIAALGDERAALRLPVRARHLTLQPPLRATMVKHKARTRA